MHEQLQAPPSAAPWLVAFAPLLLRAVSPEPLRETVEWAGGGVLPVTLTLFGEERELAPIVLAIGLYGAVALLAPLPPILRLRAWAEADRG